METLLFQKMLFSHTSMMNSDANMETRREQIPPSFSFRPYCLNESHYLFNKHSYWFLGDQLKVVQWCTFCFDFCFDSIHNGGPAVHLIFSFIYHVQPFYFDTYPIFNRLSFFFSCLSWNEILNLIEEFKITQ